MADMSQAGESLDQSAVYEAVVDVERLPELQAYALSVRCAQRLQTGLAQLAEELESRVAACSNDTSADDVDHERLAREQKRGELYSGRLRARANFGERLLMKLAAFQSDEFEPLGTLRLAPEAVAPMLDVEDGSLPIRLTLVLNREAVRETARRADEVIQRTVLEPFLSNIVLFETPQLWEYCHQDTPPGPWHDLRRWLWQQWEQALAGAGLALDIPQPGTPIDFVQHEVVERVAGDSAQGSAFYCVAAVHAPGVRWQARDNSPLAPAKVVAVPASQVDQLVAPNSDTNGGSSGSTDGPSTRIEPSSADSQADLHTDDTAATTIAAVPGAASTSPEGEIGASGGPDAATGRDEDGPQLPISPPSDYPTELLHDPVESASTSRHDPVPASAVDPLLSTATPIGSVPPVQPLGDEPPSAASPTEGETHDNPKMLADHAGTATPLDSSMGTGTADDEAHALADAPDLPPDTDAVDEKPHSCLPGAG